MKIFLSWSKTLSRDVANHFADWLPNVIQECSDPFISTDIDKGEPWFETITSRLGSTDLGIVFITADNQESTWLNFEAGAMINKFGKSGVCPVLVGLKKGDYDGPLKNLQLSELSSKQDVRQLLGTINKKCTSPLDSARLDRLFEVFWTELHPAVEGMIDAAASGRNPAKVVRTVDDKIDEVLTLVRGLSAMESQVTQEIEESRIAIHEAMSSLVHRDELNFMRERERRRRYETHLENRAEEKAVRDDIRMKNFSDKYGSVHGFRKSDGAMGEVIDYAERNGKLHSVRALIRGESSPTGIPASDFEISPF